MTRLRRLSYWVALIAAYWLCAFWLVRWVSPIWEDGSGPTATFYWGTHPPTPTPEEYRQNTGVRLQFLFPYWAAASLITVLGCGLTTWLVRLWQPKRSLLFLASAATTLFLLLIVGAVLDVGIAKHIWTGPPMYAGLTYALPFLKIMVPISLFAGLLAVMRDRMIA